MGDINYANIMLEFEKLSERLDSLEEILGEYAYSRHTPTLRYKSISAEEISRFWKEERATKFNNFKGEKS